MTIVEATRVARNEPDFRSRVEFFIVKAAIAVTTEDPVTVSHAERLVLAHVILANSEGYITRFALGAMTNPTLQAAASHDMIPDGDLEFTINSIYNSFTSA